jgi:REP element-mobilizing transposase RayT
MLFVIVIVTCKTAQGDAVIIISQLSAACALVQRVQCCYTVGINICCICSDDIHMHYSYPVNVLLLYVHNRKCNYNSPHLVPHSSVAS